MTAVPRIAALDPRYAVAGGRVVLRGGPFEVSPQRRPVVRVGSRLAPLSFAQRDTLACLVPPDAEAGTQPVRVDVAPGETAFLEVAEVVATGVHAVDNPAVGPDGAVYVTCSGSRGQQTPVSVYRCTVDGRREVYVSGVANATALAFDPQGRLHVSSRFDGTVSRIGQAGRAEVVASDLGVACGLAFAPDGTLLVGDRTGTVFVVAPGEDPRALATLPSSIAAFHLALAPDGRALYVSGPTLSTSDVVYRVGLDGSVEVACRGFGRPQGLAVDRLGRLHVVDALAGACGVYRVEDGVPRLVVAASSLVGLAFDDAGGLWLTSNDTLYRFAVFEA